MLVIQAWKINKVFVQKIKLCIALSAILRNILVKKQYKRMVFMSVRFLKTCV